MSEMQEEHMPSVERLKELLVGKKVVRARIADERPEEWTEGPTGYLTLSDGTELKVWGNDGGCACSAGCYPLAALNAFDNIITNVEIEENPADDYSRDESDGHYRIFVYAENQRINLVSFEGSDGNGYYGTGWYLAVSS